MLLYVCSSNRGKLGEFALAAEKVGGSGIEILPLPDLRRVDAPEENGATFEENAVLKAIYYSQFTAAPVIADDSGLAVDALGGQPGIYSARYAGLDATDPDNIALLLKNLAGRENRDARFVCVIAMAQAGKLLLTAHGEVAGEILREARGESGFGYDPVFFHPLLKQSFGQLEPHIKFSVSHRGNALRSFFSKLEEGTAPGS